MISYYFKSKEHLLLSIFEKSVDDLSNIQSQLRNTCLTAIEKLYRLLDFYAAKILLDGASIYIMVQEQLVKSIDRSRQLIDEINERQYTFFQAIVKAGIDDGAFKPDTNVRMILYTLLGTLRHIVIVHNVLWTKGDAGLYHEQFKHDVAEANTYLKKFLAQMVLK